MNATNLQKAIDSISTAARDSSQDTRVSVSYRPNAHMEAMIYLISKLSKRSPSVLLAEMIPTTLAEYAVDDGLGVPVANAASKILESAGSFERGSALDILCQHEYIVITNDNSEHNPIDERSEHPSEPQP